MHTFGDLLRGFRRREGLSQETLADTLGVHRNSISDWERDQYLPRTRQMVLDLSEALNLDQSDTDRLLRAAEYPLEYNNLGGIASLFTGSHGSTEPEEERNEVEKSVFVDRENELAQLNQLLTDVLKKRQGCVAFVKGEAGSGKTALVQEFSWCALHAHADLVVVGGSGNAYIGVGDPYLPFREILSLLTFNLETRWAADASVRKYTHRLRTLIPVTILALLKSGQDLIDTFLSGPALIERASAASSVEAPWLPLLKKQVARKAVDLSSISPRQQNLFEQYTLVLRSVSRQQPLVLVLDDLQWADNGSIGLLFHLGKQLRDCQIMILGVYRPADVALGRDGKRHPLEPVINEFQIHFGHSPVDMERAMTKQFIQAFLDTEPNRLGAEFQDALFQHTRGHALFTIEMLRSMQKRGDLFKDASGRWIEGPNLDWQTLPARIDGVIRERIDRLPEQLKDTLRVASVEGEEFHAEVVAQVQKVDSWTVARQLSGVLDKQHRLVTSQISRRVGSQRLSHYRFRHILFQQYLYTSLDKVEKAFLHEMVGNTLERLYADQTEAIAVQLARHFHEAELNEKAVQYLVQAGKRALKLSANKEAVAHFNEALVLLPSCPDNRERVALELDLQIGLGMALIAIKGYAAAEVEHTYIRARELSHQAGNMHLLFQVLAGLWVCYFVRAELNMARELGRQLLDLGKKEQNPVVYLHAHRTLGATLCAMGEFKTAIAHCEQGTALYRIQHQRHHDSLVYGQNPGVVYPAYAAIALWSLGFPDQALNRSRESIALAKELDQPFSLAFSLGMSSFFHHLRREEIIVRKRASSALRLSTEKGFSQWIVSGIILRGWALTQQSRENTEIKAMRQALDGWQATKANLVSPYFMLILAEAYAVTGQIDAGLTTLAEALTVAKNSGERWLAAEVFRLQGELMLKQGKADTEIDAIYSQALDVAIQQKAKSFELRTVMSLSRLRLNQGRQAEALQMLTETYRWFKEGFDTPDLREAKAMLEAIS